MHGHLNHIMMVRPVRADGSEPTSTARASCPGHLRGKEHGAASQSRKESDMTSRKSIWVAGLAAFLLGVPLAEKAAAEDTEEVFFATFDFIWAIIDAASSSS